MTTELKIPEVMGPYRIKSKLGQGGMGAVYHAVHETLERPVALKILPPEMSSDPEYVTRFLREARVVATLRHDNIVQVYDAGSCEGKYYIAMELIDGANLGAYLEQKKMLSETEGLELLLQAAKGLTLAHDKGLVHRDIKPDNMLLDKDYKTLRLVDFGLVMESTSTTQLTATGACLGTPQFMSPEQADGEKADGRTDIYSLGVTFYRAFTGQPPFNSPTVMNLLFKHKFEAPPDPRTVNPQLSQNVANLLLTMMAKRREDRPQTAGDVVRLIEELRAGKPIPPPPVFVSPLNSGTQVGVVTGQTGAVPATIQEAPRKGGNGLVLALVGGTVFGFLALVGVAAYFLWPENDGAQDSGAAKGDAGSKNKANGHSAGLSDARSLIARGDEAMGNGDFRAALDAYTQASKVSPGEPGLEAKLNAASRAVRRLELIEEAAKLEQAGDFASALKRYEDAAALGDPDKLRPQLEDLQFKVCVQEAKRLENAGDFAQALKKAEEANQLKDASVLVRNLKFKVAIKRGEEAEKAGDPTTAALAYEEAAGCTDEARLKEQYVGKATAIRQRVFIDRAREFETQEDWKSAELAYDQALKLKADPLLLDKKNEMARKAQADTGYNKMMAEGELALSERRYNEAHALFKRAYEAKPSSKTPGEKMKEVEAWLCLERGDAAFARADYDLAQREYERVPGMCLKLKAIAEQKLAETQAARRNATQAQDISASVNQQVKAGATSDALRAVNAASMKEPTNAKLLALRAGLERLQAIETIVFGVNGVLRKGRDSASQVLEVDPTSNNGKTIRDKMDDLTRSGQGLVDLARVKFTNGNHEGLKDSLDNTRSFARDAGSALDDAKVRIDEKAKDEEFIGVKPLGISIGKKGDKEKARRLRQIAQDFGKQAEEARQYSR